MGTYNIGETATRSGVSAKMIRHYEEAGLIPKARRTASGYRTYVESDVHMLRFIRQARDLGFSIRQIGELLGLWLDHRRRSSEVRALALAHIRDLEAKIAETQAMKATLEHLVHCCRGNERPECPILNTLAESRSRSAESASRSDRRTTTLRSGRKRASARGVLER